MKKRFWIRVSAAVIFGLLMGWSAVKFFFGDNLIWAIGMLPFLGMFLYSLITDLKASHDFEKSLKK